MRDIFVSIAHARHLGKNFVENLILRREIVCDVSPLSTIHKMPRRRMAPRPNLWYTRRRSKQFYEARAGQPEAGRRDRALALFHACLFAGVLPVRRAEQHQAAGRGGSEPEAISPDAYLDRTMPAEPGVPAGPPGEPERALSQREQVGRGPCRSAVKVSRLPRSRDRPGSHGPALLPASECQGQSLVPGPVLRVSALGCPVL